MSGFRDPGAAIRSAPNNSGCSMPAIRPERLSAWQTRAQEAFERHATDRLAAKFASAQRMPSGTMLTRVGRPGLPDAPLVQELRAQPVAAEPMAELVREPLAEVLRRAVVAPRVEQLRDFGRGVLRDPVARNTVVPAIRKAVAANGLERTSPRRKVRIETPRHPRRVILARLPGLPPLQELLEIHLHSPPHRPRQSRDYLLPCFGNRLGTGQMAFCLQRTNDKRLVIDGLLPQ